jgi:hypothetical protein
MTSFVIGAEAVGKEADVLHRGVRRKDRHPVSHGCHFHDIVDLSYGHHPGIAGRLERDVLGSQRRPSNRLASSYPWSILSHHQDAAFVDAVRQPPWRPRPPAGADYCQGRSTRGCGGTHCVEAPVRWTDSLTITRPSPSSLR